MPVCPGCSKKIQEEWRFCRAWCHALVSEIPPVPATVGDFVSSEVVARLILSSELPGLLNKSLEVEEGQAALLFLNGRHDTTLTPGKYSLGNVLTGRGGDASVVLCRRCFQESSIGTKFCPNCGETLMFQPG